MAGVSRYVEIFALGLTLLGIGYIVLVNFEPYLLTDYNYHTVDMPLRIKTERTTRNDTKKRTAMSAVRFLLFQFVTAIEYSND